eukprot:g567.t1
MIRQLEAELQAASEMLDARESLVTENRSLSSTVSSLSNELAAAADAAALREQALEIELEQVRHRELTHRKAEQEVQSAMQRRNAELQRRVDEAEGSLAERTLQLQLAMDQKCVLELKHEKLGQIHIEKLGEADAQLLRCRNELQGLKKRSAEREAANIERETELRTKLDSAAQAWEQERSLLLARNRTLCAKLAAPDVPCSPTSACSTPAPLQPPIPTAATAAQQIWRHMCDCSCGDFELCCKAFMEAEGFQVRHNGKSGDHGIDLALMQNGVSSIAQCKQWRRMKVGEREIREFHGVMTTTFASHGYFLTTHEFTKPAQEYARAHCRSMELWGKSAIISKMEHMPAEKLQRMLTAIAALPRARDARTPTSAGGAGNVNIGAGSAGGGAAGAGCGSGSRGALSSNTAADCSKGATPQSLPPSQRRIRQANWTPREEQALLDGVKRYGKSSRTEEHLKTKLKNIQKKNRRQERKEQQQAQQGGIARALAKDLEGMHISSGGEVVDLS